MACESPCAARKSTRSWNVNRNSPLTVAVQTGNLGLVDLLIAKGADVRAPFFLTSPLREAFRQDFAKIDNLAACTHNQK